MTSQTERVSFRLTKEELASLKLQSRKYDFNMTEWLRQQLKEPTK